MDRLGVLHLVQGGIENGDKRLLERRALKGGIAKSWIAPKAANVGDDVVVFIRSLGFFATAKVKSAPAPRPDWPRRWGADLDEIELIDPPISLGTIRRRLPDLTWAIYPRSIATIHSHHAERVRELIAERRRDGLPDLDDDALDVASLEELRRIALYESKSSLEAEQHTVLFRARSKAIKRFVLMRAEGTCEYCGLEAPFLKDDGGPYLEPHHVTRVADEGPDHPANVIALCPNCHRRAHCSQDRNAFNESLKKKLRAIERSKAG